MESANRFMVSVDDTTGDYQFLVSDISSSLLDETSTVSRASHVEPVNLLARKAFYLIRYVFSEHGYMGNLTRKFPCKWRVNLSPVNGPIVPVDFAKRKSAIEFEINYLETSFL